jgi:prepilin-type N-terminal cleavage/methylation domain-containing protein
MRPVESKLHQAKGFGLIEVLIAMAILLVGLAAMLNMFMLAAGLNANQGEVAQRVTEYAQDKMEQLLALDFSDGSTDTTVYPPVTGGTGLGGVMAASTTVPTGGIVPASPVSGYVDYLDASGNLLPDSNGALYIRQWSVSTDATATLKTVNVMVRAIRSLGAGRAPSTTLVSYKSQTQ